VKIIQQRLIKYPEGLVYSSSGQPDKETGGNYDIAIEEFIFSRRSNGRTDTLRYLSPFKS
jgi:hypothetical protein